MVLNIVTNERQIFETIATEGHKYCRTVKMDAESCVALSRLQHSVSDPPPPGRAEVWGRNTVQLKPGILHLLIVSNLLALLSFQGENPLRDLKRRDTHKTDVILLFTNIETEHY